MADLCDTIDDESSESLPGDWEPGGAKWWDGMVDGEPDEDGISDAQYRAAAEEFGFDLDEDFEDS